MSTKAYFSSRSGQSRINNTVAGASQKKISHSAKNSPGVASSARQHRTVARKLCIIGCGYVGLPTAAILANCGYKVFALEINPERLAAIKAGQSFFYEAGLEPLTKAGLASGNLVATDSYEIAIPASDVVFSCVGTPDNADGSSNLSYVFEAAAQAGTLMKAGTIFVQKSTVPVGTGSQIENRFAKLNKKLSYVSNPEFLREGTAVADAL